ncbi:MAG TPA: hypothetical protein VH352_11125 [Pseudonocardiaceae bacterium]|jgi:hypothetical protein|nr:hypothetical protein [Pseudonocardiaceae bacterium]
MSRSKPNKPLLVLIAVAHVIITSLTWRDLSRRPAEQVRGSKLVWRVAAAANTMGSVAYLLIGRRSARHASADTD